MNAPAFTPGPWTRCGGYAPLSIAIDSPQGYIVFRMADPAHDKEPDLRPIRAPDAQTQQANARLISAAPELFIALGRLLEAAEAHGVGRDPRGDPLLNEARHALAKAVQP